VPVPITPLTQLERMVVAAHVWEHPKPNVPGAQSQVVLSAWRTVAGVHTTPAPLVPLRQRVLGGRTEGQRDPHPGP
jgi:hypothetical protein